VRNDSGGGSTDGEPPSRLAALVLLLISVCVSGWASVDRVHIATVNRPTNYSSVGLAEDVVIVNIRPYPENLLPRRKNDGERVYSYFIVLCSSQKGMEPLMERNMQKSVVYVFPPTSSYPIRTAITMPRS
jgi:hypothetical protein